MSVVLFPSQPFSPREIDPDFETERSAAHAAGFSTALIDHTRVMGAAAAAVALVPDEQGAAPYRGWMLKPNQYEAMYAELKLRGTSLINSPQQYRTCHYLPEAIDALRRCFDRTTGGTPSPSCLIGTGAISRRSTCRSRMTRFGASR